ncbi:phosphatase PAP2 family protein [Microbacterium sp. W1N]|uniref:phosphatase PAP2 family protein n=1 Tax=Microbacterium festucae TaxID=2977531 RepID=UPI0021BEA042|nr:phosphatase PAP2 family protein [Microbacterium festucae]MCT9821041.1 phosphatase PAP2 family protein [Microbacterium festucae]
MSAAHPRPRTPRVVASVVGLGVFLTGALTAAPAYAADGFTDAQKQAVYSSDTTAGTGSQSAPDPANWSVAMMDVFTDLRTDRGEGGNAAVMDVNDQLTSSINLGATDAQRERAIVDQYGDMALTMADGLGARLGDIYATAWEAGELPKTRWLLSKSGGKVGSVSSTNPPKNFFDFDRPYLRLDPQTQLRYVDREGGDAWGSTSGAFPSGHTSQAYWQGVSLATLLPELAPQILARTSEAGHNRIVMGAHYPLDVISGRMMGEKIVQLRLADDAFRALMDEASAELRSVLAAGCGATLATCIADDTPYLPTDEALAVYADRLHYDFPTTGPADAAVVVPEGAETLLLSSHPELTADQRRQVLALTAAPSGHPLDVGEQESWQRLDLAAAMSAQVTVAPDGTVSLGSGTGQPPVDPEPTPEPTPTPGPTTQPTPTPAPTTPAPSATTPAAPVADGDDLPAAAEGRITATLSGSTVSLGGLTAGERYFVYAYSTPTALGWTQADAAGTASVSLPAALAPGAHRIAVLSADGTLVGWAAITVPAATPAGSALPATGGDAAGLWVTGLTASMVLAAGIVLALRHRARRA